VKFGKNYDEFRKESGGNSDFLRALKEGDTEVVFLTETEEWVGYYEHYDPRPNGFSFPCTQEEDCPGCVSKLDKMRSKGRKVAIPVVVDSQWVNVIKLPKKFAERLAKRGERFGTMKDREFTLTRTGLGQDTDYDVETGPKTTVDYEQFKVPNIEQMLQSAWDQAWGEDSIVGKEEEFDAASEPVQMFKPAAKKAPAKKAQSKNPPF